MGEYALRNKETIKIGTCADMYYLRLEDRAKVEPLLPGNIDPAHTDGLRFRLPFPDEDAVPIGDYEPFNRGIRLYRLVKDPQGYSHAEDWEDRETMEDAGTIQLSHSSGLLLGVNCYHGLELPVVGYDVRTAHWNGKTHSFEMTSVKLEGGVAYGVVSCRHCRGSWRYDLADLLEWVPDLELRARLARYREEFPS